MARQTKDLDPRLRKAVLQYRPEPVMRGLESPPAAEPEKRILCQLAGNAKPAAYGHLQWQEVAPSFYSVSVPISQLEGLARQPEVLYVEAGRALHTQLNSSCKECGVDRIHAGLPGHPQLKGKGVAVGIIDIGFDYTLDDFRNPDGSSRIAFLWDQSLTPQVGERNPGSFPYGVEYNRDEISASLRPGVDSFAKVRHEPQASAHGAHVASIAAGNGRSQGGAARAGVFIGAAPEATLILVQPALEKGVSTFADSVHVIDAAAYIFEKASQLGMSCVINLSMGQNGGSHDGESLVERAIDSMLTTPGRAFVCAAGNEHVWMGHAAGKLAQGQRRTLSWRVGGDGAAPVSDRTVNEMEIWYSSRDLFEVRLISPSGAATKVVLPANTESITLPSGNVAFIDSERFHRLNGDALIYLSVDPGGPGKTVERGVWKVELHGRQITDGRWQAWIERDRRAEANGGADQSRFDGPDFEPNATLGTPGTARRTISVANYNHVGKEIEQSSSRGPTRDGRMKPEIAAPGTDILAACALGNRKDPASSLALRPVRVRKTGTSMAAPHVAGVIALIFERRGKLTAEQVRKLLIASANPVEGQIGFDIGWGFGRLDAVKAIELLNAWIPE